MSFLKVLAVVLTSFAIMAAPTIADAKGAHGGKVRMSKSTTPHGWERGRKMGWNGGNTPPGWSKVHKTGWPGGMLAPGLSKRR